MTARDEDRRTRSSAEWVTFAVSVVVLGVVVALIAVDVGRDEPPRPVVAVMTDRILEHDGVFDVPVDLRNDGGRAAVSVQVLAELVTPDGTVESEQTVDVLGVDERVRLVFVFTDDPADGELTVSVGGYAVP